MSASLFAAVEMAPRDPILGLNEAFNAEKNPNKVNLGVGVYSDDAGKIPLLECVKTAEKLRQAAMLPRGYQHIEGPAAYNTAVQHLLLGKDSALLAAGRAATFEAIGGTGALKVGADYLRRLLPTAKVAISDPSWENHRALFEAAGFIVDNYRYYDPETRGVKFSQMCEDLKRMSPHTIVVLHACCHNPTGADLTLAQWQEVAAIMSTHQLIPFLDMAYQGFADGVREDAAVLNVFAQTELQFFVASSFSKSFSLYGERIGALTVITANREETARVISQIKRVIRTNYSNPPTHGAAVVATVLNDPALSQQWQEELGGMRIRIRAMRNALVDKLAAQGISHFSFINQQRGMFSYTGLTAAQVERLRSEFGIYAVSTGRICVAALNTRNIDYVANAIVRVL